MGKNNKQQPLKQFQRFGIRKFNQGVASVMIASGMFFLKQKLKQKLIQKQL